MERRTFDAPMDFEYDNKHGRIPADSPWMSGRSAALHQSFDGLSSMSDPLEHWSCSICNSFTENYISFDANATRKPLDRNFDNLNSESSTIVWCDCSICNQLADSKMSFEADSIHNTLPQTPIKNHLANFRDNPSVDFSSGAENQSSPENGDTEATPDVPEKGIKSLNDNVTVFRGTHSPGKAPTSPTKSLRRSITSYFTLPARFSPSHKALVRKDQTTRALQRPTKRKRKDITNHRLPESDSDYDELPSLPSSPRKPSNSFQSPPPTEVGLLPSILTFINDHPSLPHILSWWAQMLLSTFILFFLSYILYSFWAAIRHDVDLKADELSRDILNAIAQCSEDFTSHGCADRSRLGGTFKRLCDEWEGCMAQDPRAVGRARISAQTWAGILNGFVEPLSGKIIAMGAGAVVLAMAVPHVLFGVIRRKEGEILGVARQQGQQSQGNMGMDMHSPPPQRQGSYGQVSGFGGDGFYTPSRARSYDASEGGMIAGRRSPSKELRWGEEGNGTGSPVKRIGYR